jgi:preprotein translocase subunit SecA
MGQRDPLVEYQREGFDLFNAMMDAIKEESVGFLFHVEVQVEQQAPPPVLDMNALVATGPGEAPGEVVAEPVLADTPAAPTQAERGVFSPAVEELEVPAQPAVAASGIAGEPVPSAAPAAFVEEQSLEVEQGVVPDQQPAPVNGGGLPADFGKPERPSELQYTAPTPEGGVSTTKASPALDGVVRASGEQSRNELCACGSGKKYKRCHGDPRHS